MKHNFDLIEKHLGNYRQTNIYYQINPDFFEELLSLLKTSPRFYFKKLEAKGSKHDGWNPKFKHLKTWIDNSLPMLQDDFYSTKTKVYWIVAGLTNFPNCRVCGKSTNYFKKQVTVFAVDPYPKSCCYECAHNCKETSNKISLAFKKHLEEDPNYVEKIQRKSRQTRFFKNGEGVWISKSSLEKTKITLKNLVAEDPDFFKKKEAKKKATNILNGHDSNWHNAEKMVEIRYLKNNGVWITEKQLESRKTTSLERYGCEDPNSSELVKLHKKNSHLSNIMVLIIFGKQTFSKITWRK